MRTKSLNTLRTTAIGVTIALYLGATASHAQSTENTSKPYTTVSSTDFAANAEGITFVDVREPKEWSESGIPHGATGISISRPDFVEAVLAATSGNKDQPVAVICRSGTRSQRAAQQLSDAGFTNVTNIGDGMIGRDGVGDGWLASGLDVDKHADTTE